MLGNYKKILTDSGPYFSSNILKRWCDNKGVGLRIATLAHPEANGCCERFIRLFRQSIVKMGANAVNWHTLISPVINGYNNCRHSTTGYSPILCHYMNLIKGNPLYDNIMVNVNKSRRSIVINNKKDAFNLSDSFFVVARIRNIKKHGADRHFRDRKW
jgi:transposase InsO family protein